MPIGGGNVVHYCCKRHPGERGKTIITNPPEECVRWWHGCLDASDWGDPQPLLWGFDRELHPSMRNARATRSVRNASHQFIDCALPGQPLVRIPELVSHGEVSTRYDYSARRGAASGSCLRIPKKVRPSICPQFPWRTRRLTRISRVNPARISRCGPCPARHPLRRSGTWSTLRARVGHIVQLISTMSIPGISAIPSIAASGIRAATPVSLLIRDRIAFRIRFHGSSTGNIYFHV